MKRRGGHTVLAVMALLAALCAPMPAATIWEWSFDGEAGQFITDGTGSGAGTYTLIDFTVTSSASGAPLGSLSGGQYITPVYGVDRPMLFEWDGSQVTKWIHSGSSYFDWWAFGQNVGGSQAYFFGWDFGFTPVPGMGSRFDGVLGKPLALGEVTVSPGGGGVGTEPPRASEVPEPAAYLLLGGGLAALALLRRRA